MTWVQVNWLRSIWWKMLGRSFFWNTIQLVQYSVLYSKLQTHLRTSWTMKPFSPQKLEFLFLQTFRLGTCPVLQAGVFLIIKYYRQLPKPSWSGCSECMLTSTTSTLRYTCFPLLIHDYMCWLLKAMYMMTLVWKLIHEFFLSGNCVIRRRGPFEHILQTFCILHPRIRADRQERVGSPAGAHRKTDLRLRSRMMKGRGE